MCIYFFIYIHCQTYLHKYASVRLPRQKVPARPHRTSQQYDEVPNRLRSPSDLVLPPPFAPRPYYSIKALTLHILLPCVVCRQCPDHRLHLHLRIRHGIHRPIRPTTHMGARIKVGSILHHHQHHHHQYLLEGMYHRLCMVTTRIHATLPLRRSTMLGTNPRTGVMHVRSHWNRKLRCERIQKRT